MNLNVKKNVLGKMKQKVFENCDKDWGHLKRKVSRSSTLFAHLQESKTDPKKLLNKIIR